MYTSCGWFFDEISGIETVQIIAYAGRVLQLAGQLFGEPGHKLEEDFLAILLQAQSNVAEIGNGAEVYRRFVTSRRVDMEHVGAHYAISSMFRTYPPSRQLFCYDVHRHSYDLLTSGHGRLALGRASVRSRVTEDTEEICFAVLHLGDQNLSAAVKRFLPSDEPGWNISTRTRAPPFARPISPNSFGSSTASSVAHSTPSPRSSPTNSTASSPASLTRPWNRSKPR